MTTIPRDLMNNVRFVFKKMNEDNDPEPLTMIIPCMTTKCAQCKQVIKPDSIFFCVANPFFASLHIKCSPHFNYYSQSWPHESPACFYQTNNQNI